MPYSIRGSQTRIYPGTIRQLSMSTRTQAQLSKSTRTQTLNGSMPNQWARSQLLRFKEDQISMSTRKQALNWSMPNQWAWSKLICLDNYQQSMVLIDQCQTIGHDLNLCVSTRTSYQPGMGTILWAINVNRKLVTIDAKPMDTILNLFVNTRNDYALAVNSTESLYQLMYLSCYKLKLIEVITIPTSVSISHD